MYGSLRKMIIFEQYIKLLPLFGVNEGFPMIECRLVELGFPVLLHVPPRLLARLLLLHLHPGHTALVAKVVLSRVLVIVSGRLVGVHEIP